MNGLKQNTFKSCNKVQGGWSIHTRYGFDIVFLICKLQKNPVSKKKKKKSQTVIFSHQPQVQAQNIPTLGKKTKQDSSKLRAASFSLPVTLVSEGSESWVHRHPHHNAWTTLLLSSIYIHIHIRRNFLLAWMEVEFLGQKDNNFIWPLKQQQSPPTKKTWKSNSGSHSETHTTPEGEQIMTLICRCAV